MTKEQLVKLEELKGRSPINAEVSGLDLVVIRYDDQVSDLFTIDYEMNRLKGISYAGISSN